MISIAYAVAVLAHLLMCSAQNTTEVCEKECSEVCEPCHPKMECNGTDVKLCHPKIDCTKLNLTDCGEQPNNPLEGLCPPKKVCVEKEFNCPCYNSMGEAFALTTKDEEVLKTCNDQDVLCHKESELGNNCKGQAYCEPKGNSQKNDPKCDGFCPVKCDEDEVLCKQPDDPTTGCNVKPICKDKSKNKFGGVCREEFKHCDAICKDNEVRCDGKEVENVPGCYEADKCVERPPMQNNSTELCPGICPVYCNPETQIECKSQIDPDTGCKTQATCVEKKKNKQNEDCLEDSASHGCTVLCPKNQTLCPGKKTLLGCLTKPECVPIKYGKSGKVCPKHSVCPTVCEPEEQSHPDSPRFDDDGCQRPNICVKIWPKKCNDDPMKCPKCRAVFPAMANLRTGICSKDQIRCPETETKDTDGCPIPYRCGNKGRKTKGNDVNGECPAHCPAVCKDDEILCASQEDCDGCKTAEVCKPKQRNKDGNFCPDDSASHGCPIICNEEIGQVLCTMYEDILGCKPKAECATRMKSSDGQFCPEASVCPVKCSPDEMKCPDGIDELGCPRADCCISRGRDYAGNLCPGAPGNCPPKCMDTQYLCPGILEANGCYSPGQCVTKKKSTSNGDDCPIRCPVPCKHGELSVFGKTNEFGCLVENSCEPLSFLAVAGDEVSGPYIGPEGLKLAKESIEWIKDDTNRLVAEVHPLTGLKRDPEVVGGQNQGLGMDEGFNKRWQNRNDINELMNFAQTYLDDREFSHIGNGWCRPDDCDVTDDKCRVNGYYKDKSNSDECKEACISHIPSCTGYAISEQSYKYPNRCYIYGNINSGNWQWESSNAWHQMEWSDPASHFVPSMTQTIEREGLSCFRRNVVSDEYSHVCFCEHKDGKTPDNGIVCVKKDGKFNIDAHCNTDETCVGPTRDDPISKRILSSQKEKLCSK